MVPLLLDYLVASVKDVTLACYQWRSRSGALICVQLHGSEWSMSVGLIYEDLTVQQHEAVKMEWFETLNSGMLGVGAVEIEGTVGCW